MKYSRDGLKLTESFEGLKLTAYQDTRGVWTIAWGHTKGVVQGMTCTQAQAEAWLAEDIAWAEAEVNQHVHVVLTQHEFDALVDFTFNCGCGNLLSSALLRLVNAGQMALAAAEFEKWDKAGGKVVAGILRRRVAEDREFEEA